MSKILRDEDFKRKFPIKLVKCNNEWASWYEDEKTNLMAKLVKYKVNIYHIGSTAIPNIYSKDIIDIILEIYKDENFDSIIDILRYKYDREGYTAGKTKFIKDIIKRYSLHK